MAHIRSADLGFDKDQVVVVNNFQNTPNRDRNYLVRKELEKLPGVIKVGGFLDDAVGMRGGATGIMQLRNSNSAPVASMAQLVDYNYLDVIGLEWVEGRNFSPEFPSELQDGVIVNEAAVRQLGIQGSALGQKLIMHYNNSDVRIIGVVKDFHASTLHHEIIPFRFSYIDQAWQVVVKLSGREIPETLAQIEKTWKKFVPDAPLDYYFLGDAIDRLYHAELNFRTLLYIMTGLAVLIACLGLFGLAAFTAQQRVKEIGIRKVFGASITNLLTLLTREYVRLIIIANLVTDKWLDNFAYRIDIGWSLFLFSSALILLAAVLTISSQTYKVAVSNPIDSLRND